MSSIIKTLHCFSKGSEGRQAPFPPRLSEKIVPHLKADDMEVAVLATLTYSNVASQGQKRLLEVESRVCFLHGITFGGGGGGGGDRQQNVFSDFNFQDCFTLRAGRRDTLSSACKLPSIVG